EGIRDFHVTGVQTCALPISYMGLRALDTATVTFDQVRVPALNRLENFDLQRFVDLSRLGLAALAVGCCQAVLDYSIPFVKERKGIGRASCRESECMCVVRWW